MQVGTVVGTNAFQDEVLQHKAAFDFYQIDYVGINHLEHFTDTL